MTKTFINLFIYLLNMPRDRKVGYTTIGIPVHIRNRLKGYGEFGESWADLFDRMMKEIEEYRIMKQKYFKSPR